LLASFLVIFILFLFIKNKNRIYKLFISVFLFIVLFNVYSYLEESENPALQKYIYTLNTYNESEIDLNDEESLQIIDKLTGGRYSEITSSISSFGIFDFLFGKGPGYTYKISIDFSDLDSNNYSNVHFTPINLISKYGIIFTLLFFIYIVSPLFYFDKSNTIELVFTMLLSMYLVEMMFAFNIFVEPLIPFCIGYLRLNKKRDKSKIITSN
jgi:hypothetical protein